MKSTGVLELSKNLSSNDVYDLLILCFRPLGGSFVNLMEFCTIEIGIDVLGIAVKKSLKDDLSSGTIASINFSRIVINDLAK